MGRRKLPLERGTIILVSRLWDGEGGSDGGANDDVLYDRDPVWAVVNTRDGYQCRDRFAQLYWIDDDPPDIDVLEYRFDRFRVIPENKVPDYVWSLLAKKRLLGETNP